MDKISPSIGWNLLIVDDKKMKNEIVKIAGISDVNIIKKWPSEIIVNIVSMEPVLQIKSNENAFEPLDAKGRKMLTQKKMIPNVPEYTVKKGKKYDPKAATETAKIASTLLKKLPKHKMVFSANKPDDISFVLDNQWNVILGDSEKDELKAADIATILKNPSVLAGKTTINVSTPTRAVLK
jgi:cell division septal protein FtsQ